MLISGFFSCGTEYNWQSLPGQLTLQQAWNFISSSSDRQHRGGYIWADKFGTLEGHHATYICHLIQKLPPCLLKQHSNFTESVLSLECFERESGKSNIERQHYH